MKSSVWGKLTSDCKKFKFVSEGHFENIFLSCYFHVLLLQAFKHYSLYILFLCFFSSSISYFLSPLEFLVFFTWWSFISDDGKDLPWDSRPNKSLNKWSDFHQSSFVRSSYSLTFLTCEQNSEFPDFRKDCHIWKGVKFSFSVLLLAKLALTIDSGAIQSSLVAKWECFILGDSKLT